MVVTYSLQVEKNHNEFDGEELEQWALRSQCFLRLLVELDEKHHGSNKSEDFHQLDLLVARSVNRRDSVQ